MEAPLPQELEYIEKKKRPKMCTGSNINRSERRKNQPRIHQGTEEDFCRERGTVCCTCMSLLDSPLVDTDVFTSL